MLQKNSFGNVEVRRALDPDDYSGDANGATIDRRFYDGVFLVVAVGSTTTALSSTNRFRIDVEHSDDGTNWDDVEAGQLIGDTVTEPDHICTIDTDTTDEDTVFAAAYVGGKRYVRVVADETGTVTDLPLSVVALLTRNNYQ